MNTLAKVLGEHARRHSVPGAALGVLIGGVVSTAYHGVESTATGVPVTAGTRFAIGSIGKPIAATVALRLADEGLYSVDDPVAALVPELRGVGWAGRASVLDLIANRSRLPLRLATEFTGLPDTGEGVYAWPDRRFTVTPTGTGLTIAGARATVEAAPVDERTFLVDAADPDTPTMTFGAFDDDGRPGVLYRMPWAHPRVPG